MNQVGSAPYVGRLSVFAKSGSMYFLGWIGYAIVFDAMWYAQHVSTYGSKQAWIDLGPGSFLAIVGGLLAALVHGVYVLAIGNGWQKLSRRTVASLIAGMVTMLPVNASMTVLHLFNDPSDTFYADVASVPIGTLIASVAVTLLFQRMGRNAQSAKI